MLNTDEGYTPAYTLKGIAIQLLSFFDSETIAQVGTGANVELAKYRNSSTRNSADTKFHCSRCNFGKPVETNLSKAQSAVVMYENMALDCKKPLHRNRTRRNSVREQADRRNVDIFQKLIAMPQEIILLILDKLDTEELLALCGCDKIRELVTDYDLIRVRELQCFCSKRSFMEVKLGIGVHLGGGRKQGSFTSEFDLLSQEAFNKCNIRKSVQGLRFQHWMPLPISRRHWNLVRDDTDVVLTALARGARLGSRETKSNVLYHFMNDVVVKFSRTAKDCFESGYTQPTSSLTHPAEKAIESYFALFHLLLCLVVEDKKIVEDAHWMLEQFQRARLPNPTERTEDLTFLIIKEAVTRNVVWMLDPKGADMAELSYLKPSAESDYRLRRIFQASKISYRLLMFLNLFRKIARPQEKSIQQVCDEAFENS